MFDIDIEPAFAPDADVRELEVSERARIRQEDERGREAQEATQMLTTRRADEIYDIDGGWFHAQWHFSFDRYRDPEQMGVGALRVFNDDRIIAGAEWPMHPHRHIESRRATKVMLTV